MEHQSIVLMRLKLANKLGFDFVVLSQIKKTLSHHEREGMGWSKFKRTC